MGCVRFAEFFNLLNRTNPGNNFIADIRALPVPATEVDAGNVTHLCLNADCTSLGADHQPEPFEDTRWRTRRFLWPWQPL